MDVGFWIKVSGCKDKRLNLKQVEIHKYSGSVDVSIVSNVNIELAVYYTGKVDVGGWSEASVTPSTLNAPGGTVTISVSLNDVDLSKVQGGHNCLEVGTVTLKVRPNVTPTLKGGCS